MTRPGLGAWIAVLALPALAVGARTLLAIGESDGHARSERDVTVAAIGATWWSAEGELEGLGHVRARITALHADPARQAFETRALAAHGLPQGLEPYWVHVDFDADEASGARLDPRELRVEDERGTALETHQLGSAPLENGRDPIVTLLEPPAPLHAGQASSFVLLGRRPVAGARLVRGAGSSLALTESIGAAGAGDMPIARIDRTTPAPEGGQ